MIRGLGFVAKDAMEIAADSDCRRLPRKRGRQSAIVRGFGYFDILDRIYRINRIGVVEVGRVG